MKIDDLIAKSGDSKLISYDFSDGILSIYLDLDEIDDLVVIKVITNSVYGEQLSRKDDVLMTCRVELIELNETLCKINDYYVPSSNFGIMMKEVRSGASLAYGKKCSQSRWLLNVTGYSRLLSCLVEDLDKVVCQSSNITEALAV
jgi:hypothetical protein